MEDLINYKSDDMERLSIYVGKDSSGNIVTEEVLVIPLSQSNNFKLASAPGLALNLAKSDIFLYRSKDLPVEIIERGGNFNIHIYKAILTLESYENLKYNLLNQLHGSIDGIKDNNLAITVPMKEKNSIYIISNFFNNFKEITGNDWCFTNIYKNYENFNDDTLMNWWDDYHSKNLNTIKN